MKNENLNNLFTRVISISSLVGVIITTTLFIANIDKANGVQQAQIDSINHQITLMNQRYDRLEAKIDKLVGLA